MKIQGKSPYRIFLVSNMYPSRKNPEFGAFVKGFAIGVDNFGFRVVEKAIIKNKGKSFWHKVFLYLKFSVDVIFTGVSKSYDLVYVHFINHTAIPVILLNILRKKILIINAHGGDIFPRSLVGKLIHKFSAVLVKQADLFVVPSQYLANEVHKYYFIDKKRVFISPSGGVNIELFKPTIAESQKSNIYTIGYISRIDFGKGWDLLLWALKELKIKYKKKDFRAIIVGGGVSINEAKKLSLDLDVEDRVTWLGSRSHEELPNIINKFDVFVFPSKLREGLGLVGLEAMACKVPVIGSRIGGISGFIRDGYNGYTFNPGDYLDLSRKIIQFDALSDDSKESMKRGAWNTAQRYDQRKVISDLCNEMKFVIERKSEPIFKTIM